MRALKYLPQYTIEDYNLWEGDWELIDGIPYSMSPSPIDPHQTLGAEIVGQISVALKKEKAKCGNCRVVYELDWIISDSTILCPDIAIICNKPEKYIPSAPELIVEILSPSTAHKDRQVKFEIYQEQGVKYYLIIDPANKSYLIYQLVNGSYEEQNNLTSFTIHDQCAVTIDIVEALETI